MDYEFAENGYNNEKKKKYHTKEAALLKLQSYCAYQERCHREVETKLRDLGIWGDTADQIIAQLITDNFLNEERFAIAYAGGKYRVKQWGIVRIRQELKLKGVSEYSIKKGIQEVEASGTYLDTLYNLIQKKRIDLSGTQYEINAKLANYAIRKGFESDLVWQTINQE